MAATPRGLARPSAHADGRGFVAGGGTLPLPVLHLARLHRQACLLSGFTARDRPHTMVQPMPARPGRHPAARRHARDAPERLPPIAQAQAPHRRRKQVRC